MERAHRGGPPGPADPRPGQRSEALPPAGEGGPELAAYQARVSARLRELQELVEGAGAHDGPAQDPAEARAEGAPRQRDEFSDLEVGISLVLEDLRAVARDHLRAVEALRREKEQVERLARELEVRVAERTWELEARTRELEARTKDLESANAELRAQDKYKSDFLAAMSHELRTPLNAIIGYGELLQDHAAERLSKRHQRGLESVLDAARHLLSLINDLLDLSKISAGKMELAPGILATRGIMEKVQAMVAAQAEPKGLQVSLEIAPQAEVAHGDARRLEQCLLNLASNAVKFTPAGGRVILAANPHPEGVQFTVADTGPGISHEDQKRLFREFVQLQDVTRREHGGTGLGLALTKRIVELHHGRIWVDSEPGKGSAFHFVLPNPLAEPRGREVLLVDDDPTFRAAAAGWLREAGLEPVEAATGESAMAYLSGSQPSAVVLDLNLPGVPGLEVAAKVRASPATRDVPILFVSAVHLPEAERIARNKFKGAWLPKGPGVREALGLELRRLGLLGDARSPGPRDGAAQPSPRGPREPRTPEVSP